jgi:hypothetical protein
MNRKVRVVVKVAKQCDREAVQSLGPATKRNFLADNARPIRLNQNGIDGDSGDSSGGR